MADTLLLLPMSWPSRIFVGISSPPPATAARRRSPSPWSVSRSHVDAGRCARYAGTTCSYTSSPSDCLCGVRPAALRHAAGGSTWTRGSDDVNCDSRLGARQITRIPPVARCPALLDTITGRVRPPGELRNPMPIVEIPRDSCVHERRRSLASGPCDCFPAPNRVLVVAAGESPIDAHRVCCRSARAAGGVLYPHEA